MARMADIEPDIIKIDRELVTGIPDSYYKQEIFKSIVSLSTKVGALVVAEGVETEAETLKCLELGSDMLQGFFFQRPQPAGRLAGFSLQKKLDIIAMKHRSNLLQAIESREAYRRKCEETGRRIVSALEGLSLERMLSVIQHQVRLYPAIECIYVLNDRGVQLTDTYFNPRMAPETDNPLFIPGRNGTDHSMKDYYYVLKGEFDIANVTEEYISLATGNLCRTVSLWLRGADDQPLILCVDVSSPWIEG
jgi:hypothetical protein